MTSISRHWNIDENYWQLHPVMKTIRVFKNLHDKDKSKGKAQSSKLMWAIALYVDPHEDNVWRNSEEDERKMLISSDYLDDKGFNWDHPEIQEMCDTYRYHCLSIAEKELIAYEQKLVERGKFIMQTPYTLDYFDEVTGKPKKGTAGQLDTMLVNSGKLFDQLEEIKSKIAQESAEGHLRGGAAESLAESGRI